MSGSRRRLLVVTEYLNEGGVGRQIDYLVRGLPPRRWEIHLAVLRKKDLFFAAAADEGRARLHLLAGGEGIGPSSLTALVRLFRELEPSIVHCFGGKANHLAGLASLLRRPAVLIFSVRSANDRLVNHLVYRLLRGRPAVTVVNSEGIRRELTAKAGYRDEAVVTMHNFLDTARFRPPRPGERERARAELGLPPRGTFVALVGRLARQKNQLAALRAAAALGEAGELPAGARLLLVGRAYEGGYARQVERLRRDLGLEELCPLVEPLAQVKTLYRALDGLFQPSTYEGLSNVVIEGQASGLPVALARESDHDGLVEDGRTGISFPVAPQSEVTEGLRRLFEVCGESALRERVTAAALDAVRERFTLAPQLARLEGLYDSFLP